MPPVLRRGGTCGRKAMQTTLLPPGRMRPRHPTRPAQRRVAGGVGELSGLGAAGFLHRGHLPRRGGAAAGQLRRAGTEHRTGTGAPFGDALYRSSLFPWSHLCTGVQGKDPGFDPLDVFLTEAHRRGIGVEAWVNPYRLRSSAAMPPNLAENNLANTHPDWLCTAGEGAVPETPPCPPPQTMWCRGWQSFCRTTRWTAFTLTITFTHHRCRCGRGAVCGKRRSRPCRVAAAERYRAGGEGAPHGKGGRPHPAVRHQPQANPDNDLDQQYSDVTAWLAAGGEEKVIDYLCPQVYWGYGFTLQSGSTRFAFENIVPAWLS